MSLLLVSWLLPFPPSSPLWPPNEQVAHYVVAEADNIIVGSGVNHFSILRHFIWPMNPTVESFAHWRKGARQKRKRAPSFVPSFCWQEEQKEKRMADQKKKSIGRVIDAHNVEPTARPDWTEALDCIAWRARSESRGPMTKTLWHINSLEIGFSDVGYDSWVIPSPRRTLSDCFVSLRADQSFFYRSEVSHNVIVVLQVSTLYVSSPAAISALGANQFLLTEHYANSAKLIGFFI